MEQNLNDITKQSKEELTNDIENLEENVSCIIKDKVKLVFFAKQGLDSFLSDIIEGMSQEHVTKKIIVTDYSQIDEGMQWADICWFEWCDELIAYGSKLELAKEKKIICRLHSYEAFTDYINNVNWSNVDNLIVVCEHIKDFIVENFNIDEKIISIIPNGINEKKWRFKEGEKGFNIAYVGYINYKKGPMLLLHTFKAIYDKDHRYKLYIAGIFQDNRDVLYYNQMIQELGLQNNIIYEGWQDDLDKWLNNKDYILCTSILESQNMSVMQAMCKGIKPIIHNFVGAKNIYDKKYVWNTIGEAVNMIESDKYDSNEYRKYIIENYRLAEQLSKITQLITKVNLEKKIKELLVEPLVTVGIINYNYSKFLDRSIESVLNQTYNNIEIIIIDDCSIDDSIEKIKSYEKKYKNIRAIINEKNSGSGVQGFQKTISEAKGKYLMILSSDDYLATKTAIYDFIMILVNNSELDYAYCNLKLVDIDGNYKSTWRYKQYSPEEIIQYTFNRGGSGVIPITAGVYKTDFYRKNNLDWYDDKDNIVASDTLNTLIFLKNNFKYRHINKELMCYRQHDSNMTYDLKNRIKSIISVMEYIINNFSETKYLKDVDWTDLNKELIESKKNYFIGINYYNTFLMYLNGNGMPWKYDLDFDIEEIKIFLQPIINIIEKYMERSLANSNYYRDNIKVVLNEIKKYKIDISFNKESKEYILQNELVDKGKELRQNLLEKYKNKYENNNFKFLIHSPLNGYWKYSFLSWKQILNYMGVEVDIIYEINPDFNYSDYNTFINIAEGVYINDSLKNESINNIKNKIGVASKQNNNEQLDLVNIQLCEQFNYKFLITSLAEESIEKILCNWTKNNINIVNIPFAFNPLINYPEIAKKIYDYFFVGSNSYLKYEETKKFLIPILNKYDNGILRGIGWGNNVPELNPNNANYFYNRSKINLNYHLEGQKQNNTEINERTFVIASCGGFQLVDNPKLILDFYTKDDMEIAGDEHNYIEKFEYYLNKPLERLEKSYNGLVKTYEKDYSLFKSLEKILTLIV